MLLFPWRISRMKAAALGLMAVLLIAYTDAGAEPELDMENETTRINYSLGYQIGGDFKRQEVALDAEAVVQGIRDALSEAEPKLSRISWSGIGRRGSGK